MSDKLHETAVPAAEDGVSRSEQRLVQRFIDRINQEIVELDAALIYAQEQGEWRRRDRLEGAKDTCLNLRDWLQSLNVGTEGRLPAAPSQQQEKP